MSIEFFISSFCLITLKFEKYLIYFFLQVKIFILKNFSQTLMTFGITKKNYSYRAVLLIFLLFSCCDATRFNDEKNKTGRTTN